jgi:dolichol-phosphate hexosyltransferase
LSTVTLVLFRRFIWDSQSGMWILKRELLPKFQPWSDSMALSQEIKILAFTQPRMRCLEMPIFYGEHRIGESKLNMWRDGFGNLLHLFKMRLSFGRLRRTAIAKAPPAGIAAEEKTVGSEEAVAYA